MRRPLARYLRRLAQKLHPAGEDAGFKNTLPYFWDKNHAGLSDENICKNGRNLTIAILSLNRVDLTARLLDSITNLLPHFSGQILIVDNGSRDTELTRLRQILDRIGNQARLVSLPENRGVAAGRNIAAQHAKTDWVMFLDNDIFFISNPLEAIQRDLAEIGCKFLNLPLLNPDGKTPYSAGGHLHTHLQDDGRLAIGGGPSPGFLASNIRSIGSFLFGGAAIYSRSDFIRLGGFDENMKVGFEDTDFSIRLFQSGMKIGCSAVHALVHAHPEVTARDPDYEKVRYSHSHIEASARYMEAKHGFSFWNDDVRGWLAGKNSKD